MRKKWGGLRWLGVMLLFVFGCWTTKPEVRPPSRGEDYVSPPPTDPRYLYAPGVDNKNPYPEGTLHKDQLKKQIGPPSPLRTPSSMGGPGRPGAF